jgi:hypothetical protein
MEGKEIQHKEMKDIVRQGMAWKGKERNVMAWKGKER